ncbi:MAG: pilus assembly protein PilM [Deltaproteobacteria bacterium]|nr:pilus assembly protein PilM [Deltaproteobacteria bacterium]MBN2673467.1 pilus assembly protein PilM [Deltaproteobacteria bacterium]
MTQHFIGIDLGSHAVKAIAVKQGFRGGEIVKFDSEAVVQDENGIALDSEIMQAAGRVISRFNLPDASVYCALPGESVSIHRISLPTSAAKKAHDVLSFELDELLPYDVEDAVFDFIEVGRTPQEVQYQVAAVPKQRVRLLLNNLSQVEIDPAEISVAPLGYAVYLEEISAVNGPTAIVDLGHQRTNVIIAGDSQLTTRTVLRGGRELSVKLAAAGDAEYAKGAEFKEKEGMTGRIGEVLKDAFRLLVREIQQTIIGHRANGGNEVQKVLLCGGTSKLNGVAPFLGEALALPVEVYQPEVFKGDVKPFEQALSPENAVLAMCLAGTGIVPKARRFNFRRDEFAFKGDTEAIRQKIVIAVICFLCIVASWIFSTVAKYVVVSNQAEKVKVQLEEVTERVLGQKTVSRSIIEKKMGPQVAAKSPMPENDSYDIVIELSKRIPESVVHDIDELDIKPKHVKIRGKVDSELKEVDGKIDEENLDLSPTDLIKSKLGEFEECFTSFKIPKVRTVAERQEYTMEIDSTCP